MTKDTTELFQSFFAICLLLVPVFGGWERRCTPDTPIRGIYCGESLNEALAMVCRLYGGYYGGSQKRSAPSNTAFDHIKQIKTKTTSTGNLPALFSSIKDQDVLSKDLITKEHAHNFLTKRNPAGRGSSCECCYHRCSMGEMREYCSFGSLDTDT